MLTKRGTAGRILRSALLGACALGVMEFAMGAGIAHAADAAAPGGTVQLGEVIVTAQKRETNIQSTPLAVTAIKGESLQGAGPSSIETLALTTPSVQFGQTDGMGQVTIRGIGAEALTPGSEGRAAVHIDGVYLPSMAGLYGAFFDLDRVEVVRGPQGDLYGRNATAGALNIITRKPSFETNGYFNITGGTFNLIEAQGAIGGPITDSLAYRVATDVVSRGGYGRDNTTQQDINDQKTRALRGALLFKPNDRLEVSLAGDYFNEDDSNYTMRFDSKGYNYPGNPQGFGITQVIYGFSPTSFNGTPYPGATSPTSPANSWIAQNGPAGVAPTNINDINAPTQPTWKNTAYGANLTARYKLTDALSIKSITGYRNNAFQGVLPFASTTLPSHVFAYIENTKTWSEELQLNGEWERDHLVSGLYFFDNKLFGTNEAASVRFYLGQSTNPFDGTLLDYFRNAGSLEVKSQAAYINNTFDFTKQLSLTLGLRYTKDDITETNDPLYVNFATTLLHTGFPWRPAGLVARPAMSKSASNVSPRVTLTWKPDEHSIVYATYSKGFKSGGFNLGSGQPPFASEILVDYEAGLKRDWLDGRLRTNLAGFYYDYTNLQVTVSVPLLGAQVRNAAAAKLYGFEGDIDAILTDHLKVSLGASLLHTEYTNFMVRDENRINIGTPATCATGVCEQNVAGNELDKAPPYKIILGVDYHYPVGEGSIAFHADGTFVDKMYFSPFNQENVAAPAHQIFNASLRYDASNHVWVEVWGKNLTDKQVLENAYVNSRVLGSPIGQTWTAPRTLGATVGYTF